MSQNTICEAWDFFLRSSIAKAVVGAAVVLSVHQYLRSKGTTKKPTKTGFNDYLVESKPTAKQKPKTPATAQTDFNSYLKAGKKPSHKYDFNSFLGEEIDDDSGDTDEAGQDSEKGPGAEQVVITVIFGTEFGFSKEIAEKLCAQLRELQQGRYWPQLLDMANGPKQCNLSKEQVILAVCSTQGDGVAPSEAREYCDWLHGSAAPQLQNVLYSVCALGDSSYTHFCACGKGLDSRFAALGGTELVPRSDINREDWKAVDSWMQAVLNGLQSRELLSISALGGYEGLTIDSSQEQRVSKAKPFLAKIVSIDGLCSIRNTDDKDTIRVELDIANSGLDYEPGDALGIHAANAPQVVQELIDHMRADADSLQELPPWHYKDERLSGRQQISLFEALTYCYDLRQPRRSLLEALSQEMKTRKLASSPERLSNGHAHHTQPGGAPNGHHQANGHPNGTMPNGDLNQNGLVYGHRKDSESDTEQSPLQKSRKSPSEQARQLEELISGSAEKMETYLEPRHVIDILNDFDCARLSAEQVLGGLAPLQPRLYSISSSPLEQEGRVQVTIAVVRYQSLEQDRLGVTSTLLAERLKPGEKLPVYIVKNPDFRLPSDPLKPIVMVGPGTGIAPFRSFMLQRILGSDSFGESILYFGCRRQDQDYLYGDDLEDWAAQGHLVLHTAFSRQQKEKVYVQDRLKQTGESIWKALSSGGHFYVCGDALSMAGAVEAALLTIIARYQGNGADAAQSYLEDLSRNGRYQRDVWY